jgi:hypothetical protein
MGAAAATPAPSSSVRIIENVDSPMAALVGIIASIVMQVGVLLPWVSFHGFTFSAFHVALLPVLDPATTTKGPSIGWALVAIGAVTFLLALRRRARFLCAPLGLIAAMIPILYCAQIQRFDRALHLSFTDFVGFGAWVSLAGALILAVSACFGRSAGLARVLAAGTAIALVAVGAWSLNQGRTYAAPHAATKPTAAGPSSCSFVSLSEVRAVFGGQAGVFNPAKTTGEICAWRSHDRLVQELALTVTPTSANFDQWSHDARAVPLQHVGDKAIVIRDSIAITIGFVKGSKSVVLQYLTGTDASAAHEERLVALAQSVAGRI